MPKGAFNVLKRKGLRRLAGGWIRYVVMLFSLIESNIKNRFLIDIYNEYILGLYRILNWPDIRYMVWYMCCCNLICLVFFIYTGFLAGYPATETGFPAGYKKRPDIRCNPNIYKPFPSKRITILPSSPSHPTHQTIFRC